MEQNYAKQVIRLKDLPSNLVEEAIVILKPNKKVKKLEYTKNTNEKEMQERNIDEDYLVKEAQNIVNDYMEKIEKQKEAIFTKKTKLEKKYVKLKRITVCLSILLLASIIIQFF